MKCFVYVAEADVVIDVISRIVTLKTVPLACLVCLCAYFLSA